MKNEEKVLIPKWWIEALKTADASAAVDLVEKLQMEHSS